MIIKKSPSTSTQFSFPQNNEASKDYRHILELPTYFPFRKNLHLNKQNYYSLQKLPPRTKQEKKLKSWIKNCFFVHIKWDQKFFTMFSFSSLSYLVSFFVDILEKGRNWNESFGNDSMNGSKAGNWKDLEREEWILLLLKDILACQTFV